MIADKLECVLKERGLQVLRWMKRVRREGRNESFGDTIEARAEVALFILSTKIPYIY